MDDLLIALPPTRSGSTSPGGDEQPLEAEVLLAYLRQRGFRAGLSSRAAEAIDGGLPDSSGLLESFERSPAARVVYWHLPTRRALRTLLEHPPRKCPEPGAGEPLWIAGGTCAQLFAEELLARLPGLDGVVRGEPELPVFSLLQTLRRGGRWRDTPGLTVRGSGEPARNPPPPELLDLATLPAAADDLVSDPQDSRQILFSRGCESDCQYCGYPVLFRHSLRSGRRLWRTRRPGAIVEEIEHLARGHGISRFAFNAAVFFGYDHEGTEVVKRVAEEILARRLDIRFTFVTHPHHLVRNRVLLPLLVQAGLERVHLGIDSGSEAALRRYRVEFGVSDSLQALRLLHRHRVDFTPGFIFYDPYMAVPEIGAQLRFLRRIRPYFTHMEAPYAHYLDRHLLHRALKVTSLMPMVETLRRDGLLREPTTIREPPRARFQDPAVARFFRIHRSVYRRHLERLQPLLQNPSRARRDPRLHTLPVDLLEHLFRALAREPAMDEEEAVERAGAWLQKRRLDEPPKRTAATDLGGPKRPLRAQGSPVSRSPESRWVPGIP